ncbi:eukaryotic and archaeal DNA primase, large subunit-domain-containing protein [Mycena alexandri]|uniref:DNA primase large subunit n=1 Tax=Mycena alexandri TaxID=1745969 RepID=A0AAD6XE57_9AGAR|nr:eukaryotic and archaeal DNA primase, large subunit-domain-containing protein [Mycena alexandri]
MFKIEERSSAFEEFKNQVELHKGVKYLHRLNFYDKPPLYDVSIEEFETSALDRLRILAEIESSAARNRTWEETKTVTSTQCEKYLPLKSSSAVGTDKEAQRRIDHLGHFVLRLAFCRSDDLRRRFVKAETTLFKVRYETDDSRERELFLNSRDFDWVPVDKVEKEKYRQELMSYGGRADTFDTEKYYKVRWTRVPDLIDRRKVFLKGGWAYVPSREQSSIVYQEFETHLERDLVATSRYMPRLDEDTRLGGILDNLSQGFLGGVSSEWSAGPADANGESIKAEMVDDLAAKHFPMCMRNSHQRLRADHRLNHFGRLQYGLFLKVLGLSVEEAIVFWRKSFDRINDDTFNKMYKYNIRHSFGLEGKRANYPAKNCQQILTSGGDPGCPYRHFSPENLQSALLSTYGPLGLTSSDVPEVMATVKGGHFHVACTRVFEMTHSSSGVKKGDGVGSGESVTHPNQYAAKSMELAKAQEEKAAGMVVT